MNVYTCIDFTGHYPVGTAAVVVATSRRVAARVLEGALAVQGLPQTIRVEQMQVLDLTHQQVHILNDGNY